MKNMKHIKYFENLNQNQNNIPNIGDFVQLKFPPNTMQSYHTQYMDTHIGQIIDYIFYDMNNTDKIVGIKVIYNNIPEDFKAKFKDNITSIKTSLNIKNIVAFGETPEDVELKLTANKYNL